MDAPHEDALRRFHASLNVSELARSVEFYRVLLGSEPAKLRSDYAKFELDDPPLVLSLIPGRGVSGGGSLNHVGLRVRNAQELVEIQTRLEAAGIRTKREEGVECCYARQTKFWVTDPDRALWEVYVFHEDIAEKGSGTVELPGETKAPDATGTAPQIVWSHRLADPAPSRIPHDDNSVHQAKLEGSMNQRPDTCDLSALLAETHRVLRPGGEVVVHGLAGDRRLASTSPVSLPGPAAAVQYVPASADVMQAVVDAGFIDVMFEKLSQTAYFVVDGVSMRELMLTGRKPGYRPKAATHQAIYLGPLAEVTDDFGNVFHRGAVTPLNIHDWQVLARSSASQFLLLAPGEVLA